MTLSSGIGSMPGADATAYDEAVRVVLGELSLPHVPELPGRGAAAGMVGRGLAVVADLGVDLQPGGWRLTGGGPGSSSVDHRRARSLLAQDLDLVEEQAQGLDGPVKTQVLGPWTLAASVERPRGDRLLADHGARRDLAQALAEGLTGHVADLRRRVPDASAHVVQVDEPSLPAVMAGRVPTASGFGRHRTVHPPEASALLEVVLGAITDAGAQPWVHCCAPEAPWSLLRGAGARGLLVDADLLTAGGLDEVAESLEAGLVVGLGVLAPGGPTPTDAQLVDRATRLLEQLGLDPEVHADRLVLTPACGLPDTPLAEVRRGYGVLTSAARALTP